MEELKDYYKEGKCSRCGECCTPFIPITNKEYKTIKKYIKENKIDKENLVEGNNVYIKCCFYNRKEKKCNIYKVRPEVCKRFKCCNTPQQINARRKYFNDRADINKAGTKIQGMDELFYGDLTSILYYIKYLNPQNDKQFKAILKYLGREDMLEGIKEGKIKIGWRENDEHTNERIQAREK
jgi:Fe-S-cluster containining protein